MPQPCPKLVEENGEPDCNEILSVEMPKDRLALGDVTHHNIKQMQRLNQVIFPVMYNDKFYIDIQKAGELAKLAYFNDLVVGAVCCRCEFDPTIDKSEIYIMTLGCLPAYRRLGLGKLMLEHVFDYCRQRKSVYRIYLHVQVNNEIALEFYKKFGFSVVQLVTDYYKRIEPTDAYLLEKILTSGVRPLDDGGGSGSSSQKK